MAAAITPSDIHLMVRHWLNTPAGAYLGSGYGSNVKDLLQSPLSGQVADSIIAKLVADIPVLSVLPDGAINIYGVPSGLDTLDLVIEIAGQTISIGEA
jgi:hypothetical protein